MTINKGLLKYGENTLNEIYDHLRTIFNTYGLTILWTDSNSKVVLFPDTYY